MLKIHKITLASKLNLIIVGALVGIAALAAVFLVTERSLILQERQSAVSQAVETAYGVVLHYQTLAQQGDLSQVQAQQQALVAIKKLRYGQGDYFWIQDGHARMVMHPIQSKLDGTDMIGTKDPDGKLFFKEMVDVVQSQGAGFVSYQWPKPGKDKPQPKISYVKGLPAWGWIVGSGVYVDSIDTTMSNRVLGVGAGVVVLMAVMLLSGGLMTRSILRQLGGEPTYAAEVTQRMASGDLSAHIDIKYPGQNNVLMALDTMRHQLSELVRQVRSGAENLAAASAQIAQGNLDLSGRTEHQASALEETSASMEELGSTVRQNSDNARQSNQLAQSTADVAERGGAMVTQVVDTMKGIHDSSRRIVDIIGVIDGIAFQTNILALNASVEAARAGDQGRGFAVVAAEVRNLSVRSAESAKQIKSLITDSVGLVEQGTAQVDQAGVIMSEVVAGIQRVTRIMNEISTASVEQSAGVGQVGEAVVQMDRATQENAALVEEMAAATNSLKVQADDLVKIVALFKLKNV